ncbi:MAG: DUF2069 domain-containing protein [Rudaea sp.]
MDLVLGLRSGRTAALALLILEICWHAWLAPARANLFWPSLALAVLPLLPGVWIARANLRRGVLVCGIVCMFYFAHGVAELWSAAIPRALPALEIALSLVVIAALGWDARKYKRPPRHDDGPLRGA